MHAALLNNKQLPSSGWPEHAIERVVHELALMDSNMGIGTVGVGEREGRVFSGLVSRLHGRMAHGVGRSGDISAAQPKAAGSSLLNKLANVLSLDALHVAGLRDASDCAILPLATGAGS